MQENLLNMLRMQNIFGVPPIGNDLPSQGGIMGNMPAQPTTTPIPMMGINPGESAGMPTGQMGMGTSPMGQNVYEKMYTPETEISEAYKQHLLGMPQRSNPGIMRKIGASIAGGFGGTKLADEVMYGGYNRALDDWNTREQALRGGANIERQSNVNERTLAHNMKQSEIAERRISETERHNREREEVAANRAKVYQWKAEHPSWRMVEIKGGNVVAVNPVNPKETIDTGIKTGTLTDLEKHTLGVEKQEAGIKQRGDQAVRVEEARHANDVEEIVARGNQQRQTNAAKPAGTGGANANLPTQQRVAIQNNANRVKNSNPNWSKWINIEGGNVTITPPSKGFLGIGGGGPTEAEFQKINQEIFGKAAEAPVNTTTKQPTSTNQTLGTPTMQMHPNASRPAPAKTSVVPEGRVRIVHPDGRKGHVPANRLAEYLAAGYKEVK